MPDQTSDSPGNQQQPERNNRPNRGRYYYRNRRQQAENTTAETSGQTNDAPAPVAPEAPVQQQPAARGQQDQRRPQERRPQFHQQSNRLDVSVVIPLYDEEGSLKELHQQLRSTLQRMNVRYELIFVDDGSSDRSFQILRDLKPSAGGKRRQMMAARTDRFKFCET